jgi:hypothetical protein
MRGGFMFARFAWGVAAALDPAAASERDALLGTPLLRPGSLEAQRREAGLADVRATALAIGVTYADFAAYREPLAASGQAFSRCLRALPDAARWRLHDALRAACLSGDGDGPRSFAARAFAVAGRVPG